MKQSNGNEARVHPRTVERYVPFPLFLMPSCLTQNSWPESCRTHVCPSQHPAGHGARATREQRRIEEAKESLVLCVLSGPRVITHGVALVPSAVVLLRYLSRSSLYISLLTQCRSIQLRVLLATLGTGSTIPSRRFLPDFSPDSNLCRPSRAVETPSRARHRSTCPTAATGILNRHGLR